ncbi:MAG: endolytic transglycosylase MltG [Bacteroidaceae bacterium]|nr:endolytic transglycosylase MltG [Bacteroidaceae bacterium]
MKKFYILLLTSFLALGTWFLAWPVSTLDRPVRIYVDRDDNLDSVTAKISVIEPRQMVGFRLTAMLRSLRGHVHPGCYEVTPSMSSWRLATNIFRGQQTPVSVTVSPTWTKEMALAKVARQLLTDSAGLAAEFNNRDRQREFGVDTATAATLLLSNTYEMYWTTSPRSFMQRMAKERDRFWTAGRTAKAKALGMSREEVYTLASIVDAETANNGEKPTVAGLYLNRLRTGMLLQADPTVKFALGDFGLRRIYGYMLTTPSPYNTYLHAGLPPGPIRVPQTASIDAVLNAEHHDYLYMCANSDFSGTHAFAATYSEHLRNAARYVRALNERGIK